MRRNRIKKVRHKVSSSLEERHVYDPSAPHNKRRRTTMSATARSRAGASVTSCIIFFILTFSAACATKHLDDSHEIPNIDEHARPVPSAIDWLSPENARKTSPAEAKAILVARSMIEADMTPREWSVGIELRLEAKRENNRWEVSVLRIAHKQGIPTTIPNIIVVVLDDEYNVVKVIPGL